MVHKFRSRNLAQLMKWVRPKSAPHVHTDLEGAHPSVANLRALGHNVIHKPPGVKVIIDGKECMRYPDIAIVDDFGRVQFYVEVKSGSSRYLRSQKLKDEVIFKSWGIQTKLYQLP